MREPLTCSDLAIIVVNAEYERLHAAFMIAATTMAIGIRVVMFGMGAGVAAFCSDWQGVTSFSMEEVRRQKAGVAGLEELRTAVIEMGGELMVCESGVKVMGLESDALLKEVRCLGLVCFLEYGGTCRQLVF
ncbi:MAG: DsrE family protein [Acetobacter sp.]|nr:DsrE family protein [Acetobacter sp.]